MKKEQRAMHLVAIEEKVEFCLLTYGFNMKTKNWKEKKYYRTSDLWQQLELATTIGRKFVYFNGGKAKLVLFDRSNNIVATDVKMDGSVLEEKSYFNMLRLTFSSKLDCGSYIISIAKTASRKLEPWFALWRFFDQRLLCISINLPYGRAWNTIVMSGLVPLVATWNC